MKRNLFPAIAALAVCLLSACRDQPEEAAFAIINRDTITHAKLSAAFGESLSGNAGLKRAAVLSFLAGTVEPVKDSSAMAADAKELSERMSMVSGSQLNEFYTYTLLCAGKALEHRLCKPRDLVSVTEYVDSLFRSVKTSAGFDSIPSVAKGIGTAETALRRTALAAILRESFDVPIQASFIISDYAIGHTENKKTPDDIAGSVKSLFNQPAALRAGKEVSAAPITAENSLLALQYRTAQSITDTISRHIPYIKAIYKRELKLHQSIAGQVQVSFCVDTAGTVVSASVTKTDISNEVFLNSFLSYVKSIRFLAIPAKAGSMTFGFPFDFRADG
jgi:TonB family protein